MSSLFSAAAATPTLTLRIEHRAKWLHVCGDSVLDFGSGHGDEARMLREAGIDVTAFEPYENDGTNGFL